MTKWWDVQHPEELSNGNYFSTEWARYAMIFGALRGGPAAFHNALEGIQQMEPEALQAELLQMGLRLVQDSPRWRGHLGSNSAYINDQAMVSVSFSDGDLNISTVCNDPELFAKLQALAEKAIGPKTSAGRVYVLMNSEEGPKLQSIGVAAMPLETGNYNPEVIEAFRHICDDIKTLSPCGRLSILNGAPGTGKTFLIRALLAEVPNALFVVIPANLIPEMSGPGMVQALLETRNNKGDLPTVFIVEDADDCLVERAADNVNGVSALLNLGDGILGAMMDIRMVCTTNARDNELDSAVTRPGRLCRKIEVAALQNDIAGALFERLTGKKPSFKFDKATVAEVYRAARSEGWVPPKKKSSSMGFYVDDILPMEI